MPNVAGYETGDKSLPAVIVVVRGCASHSHDHCRPYSIHDLASMLPPCTDVLPHVNNAVPYCATGPHNTIDLMSMGSSLCSLAGPQLHCLRLLPCLQQEWWGVTETVKKQVGGAHACLLKNDG